jgi:hypothetical protein
VAEHFIPGYNSEHHVNHIDGNKENNDLNNLEFVSNVENLIHYNTELRKDKRGAHKHSQYDKFTAQLGHKHLGMFDTLEEAHNAYYNAFVEKFNTTPWDKDAQKELNPKQLELFNE